MSNSVRSIVAMIAIVFISDMKYIGIASISGAHVDNIFNIGLKSMVMGMLHVLQLWMCSRTRGM